MIEKYRKAQREERVKVKGKGLRVASSSLCALG